MVWQFLNIGKANAEIDRLNAENLKVTKERDDANAAVESNSTEVTKHAEELQGQVTAATSTITGLQGQVGTLTADVAAKATEITRLTTQIAGQGEAGSQPGD